MSAITFDTLKYSKTLQQAGFSQDQAEAITQAQNSALQEVVNAQQLVTKSDLQEAKYELELKISESKHELIKWLVGVSLAQIAIVVALVAFIK